VNADTKPGAPAAASPPDEFDPLGWELPLICKDCGKQFKVPYRHFQSGVVFHCPHCHGSFVPKAGMYRTVRDAFDTFYARRKRERDEFAANGGDDAALLHRQQRELEEFHAMLERIAREMHPAGEMVRRKGFRAMFT
jgi:hypothetical protein